MKIKAQFVVVRLDKEVIRIVPIADFYQEVSLTFTRDQLNDSDFRLFFNHMRPEVVEKWLAEFRKTDRWSISYEAKDLCCNLSRLSVDIVEKEVEIV